MCVCFTRPTHRCIWWCAVIVVQANRPMSWVCVWSKEGGMLVWRLTPLCARARALLFVICTSHHAWVSRWRQGPRYPRWRQPLTPLTLLKTDSDCLLRLYGQLRIFVVTVKKKHVYPCPRGFFFSSSCVVSARNSCDRLRNTLQGVRADWLNADRSSEAGPSWRYILRCTSRALQLLSSESWGHADLPHQNRGKWRIPFAPISSSFILQVTLHYANGMANWTGFPSALMYFNSVEILIKLGFFAICCCISVNYVFLTMCLIYGPNFRILY